MEQVLFVYVDSIDWKNHSVLYSGTVSVREGECPFHSLIFFCDVSEWTDKMGYDLGDSPVSKLSQCSSCCKAVFQI